MPKNRMHSPLLAASLALASLSPPALAAENPFFIQAQQNARRFDEMAARMQRMLRAWIRHADPRTSLIPNRLPGGRPGRGLPPGDQSRIYEPHNSGADLYPYLVLTAHLTDPDLYHGPLLEMLRNEIRFTTVLDSIPADHLDLDSGALGPPSIFAGAEYIKDGLVPVVELLGRTPWFYRMADVAAGIMEHAPVETRFGKLPGSDAEINGNLLQVLVRLATMTGERRYLAWAHRIGDAYVEEVLPGNHGLPSTQWDFARHTGDGECRLRNHGNEIVTGLSLLYALEAAGETLRAEEYRPVLARMFDRILESANDDGMLFNIIDSATLEPTSGLGEDLADTWGYVYDQSTGDAKYRDAVRRVLRNLPKYRDVDWGDRGSVNGYTDTIESALYLLAREPVAEAFEWIETEIEVMNRAQRPSGLVEHWYGDGNFNRTLLLYILYESQGCRPESWQPGLGVGAVRDSDKLYLGIGAEGSASDWSGRIQFDRARHRRVLNFDQDYARLNEFPEWFTVDETTLYEVRPGSGGEAQMFLGSELVRGVHLKPGNWTVEAAGNQRPDPANRKSK